MDGIWKLCPHTGGPIHFPGFNGKDLKTLIHIFATQWHFLINKLKTNYYSVGELICPAYHELCSTNPVVVAGQCPSSCNFNGDCIDGRCHCFLGFHGRDCSRREFSFLNFYSSVFIMLKLIRDLLFVSIALFSLIFNLCN